MRSTLSMMLCAIVASACFAVVSSDARAQLQEQNVLLLYNSQNARSLAIRNAYVTARPGVHELDINVDYSQFPVGDPDAPNIYAINERFVTPEAYSAMIHYPLSNYLDQNPGIYAVATTSGLPAAIARDFSPGWRNGSTATGINFGLADECVAEIIASLEAALATRELVIRQSCPDTTVPNRRGNPFFQSPLPLFEYLSCDGNGPWHKDSGRFTPGSVLFVSRLDASNALSEQDRTDAIVAMIQRSTSLSLNKFDATMIVDQADCLLQRGSRHDKGADMLHANRFCVMREGTVQFVDGPTDPNFDPATDGPFHEFQTSALLTFGKNFELLTLQGAGSPLACPLAEPVSVNYVRRYNAHPVSLFFSVESWNGWTLHSPRNTIPRGHGQALDWIDSGGSFTYGFVAEPGDDTIAPEIVLYNFLVQGFTWAEAMYSGKKRLGEMGTPIGDPLATVHVFNPDLNSDRQITSTDLAIWDALAALNSPLADLNGDGAIDSNDRNEIDRLLGRVCSDPPDVANFFSEPDIISLWYNIRAGSFTKRRGDINGDGCVNTDDIALLMLYWNSTCPDADFNNDRIVDADDLQIVLDNIGRTIADVNRDGFVDQDDYALLLASLGRLPSDPNAHPDADINLDGQFANDDGNFILNRFGQICP